MWKTIASIIWTNGKIPDTTGIQQKMKSASPVIQGRIFKLHIRPWPNDSTFLSIFSSTFDLKVEGWLNVVEHMWPNDSTFLSTFQLLIFPQRISIKNIAITNIFPPIATQLRMLSLDFLDKVAKPLDFHSTTALLLDFRKSSEKSSRLARA